MREWVPVSTSPRGRLVLAAVREFGLQPFEDVTVTGLAEAAGVTTGAIYHHFGSKLGLYGVVRDDVEQRVLDRMEGALASRDQADDAGVPAALLVGFDFAVREGFLQILGASPKGDKNADRVARLLGTHADPDNTVIGHLLAATWRAALMAVADGAPPEEARSALAKVGGQVGR